MDTPTLVGTGFVVLGAVVWIVCAVYAYQNAPRLGRNAWLWTIICLIFGPLGLMVLFVLPKREHATGSAHVTQAKKSEQEALYEVPKKKH
jgi:multisubunit Na+/H+ antiporter MnhB subunit